MNNPNQPAKEMVVEDSASSISSVPQSTGDHPEVDPTSLRGAIGTGMDQFSRIVNDNLIAARYGIFAGVTLLTVYGLSQTPLFFRYRTVSDVPGTWKTMTSKVSSKRLLQYI